MEVIKNPGDRAKKNNQNSCPIEFSVSLYFLSYEQMCSYETAKMQKPHITIGLMVRLQDS